MRYQSTVFGQLLKVLPRACFERLAQRHRQGRLKRALSPWGHLVTMVLAQVSGARSLRDLERMLERQPGVLAHLGLPGLRRSTLSDANARRPAALFAAVAHLLAFERLRGAGRREAIQLIDATRIFAGKRVEHWAAGGGVKLHVCYDPQAAAPTCFVVTPERINDIVAARTLPLEPGATYVFDKGYYDFAFWARLDRLGCRFVTRIKRNSPVRLLQDRSITATGAVLADRIVALSDRLGSQRRNPHAAPVRLVTVRIDNGREITLLTNDLDAPAETIAQLYKTRWQVELFFKWIKQNLKLSHFLGAGENAVTIQIMAALIAYLLLRRIQIACGLQLGLQACARLLPTTLFARRPLIDILKPPDKNRTGHAQLELAYA